MPPAYVKPYVKRQKNDAADAEAICEAVTRANMRFVETKTPEQQSCLVLHRGTGRAGGLNRIAPASRRDVKVGKGKQHVMQTSRFRDRDNPLGPEHQSNARY